MTIRTITSLEQARAKAGTDEAVITGTARISGHDAALVIGEFAFLGGLVRWAAGALGHVSVADPGALIGFLGPVVYESLHGRPFPPGVQTAENLVAQGILDAAVPLADDGTDAWAAIELTRRRDRPGVRELLGHDVVRLNGTQAGETAETLFTALVSFRGERCVVVGQHRRTQLADQLGLPLVCVVDAPGADLSADAEEGALASEIARCLAGMVALRVPTVSVILGEGCGGGALALLPARRVIAASNAWLSPLPPEGASAILYGDVGHAPQMARRQRVRAQDLLADGIVHALVPERPAAHLDPAGFCRAVAAEVVLQIREQSLPTNESDAAMVM